MLIILKNVSAQKIAEEMEIALFTFNEYPFRQEHCVCPFLCLHL